MSGFHCMQSTKLNCRRPLGSQILPLKGPEENSELLCPDTHCFRHFQGCFQDSNTKLSIYLLSLGRRPSFFSPPYQSCFITQAVRDHPCHYNSHRNCCVYSIFPPHKHQALLQLKSAISILLLDRVVSLFRDVASLLQRTMHRGLIPSFQNNFPNFSVRM